MTDWGVKRTYNITRIRMDMNPRITNFENDGHQVSVGKYFKDKYGVDLEPNQPLIEIAHRRDSIFLPPQLCTLETIPEHLHKRKDLIN
jgi:hypothetical protein